MSLEPGTRVRVEAPRLGAGRSEWEVAGVRGDTLLLLPDRGAGPRVAVALSDIVRLDARRGATRNAVIGAAAGLALGATGGAVYGWSRPGPFGGIGSCFIFCTEEDRERAQRPAPHEWAAIGAVLVLPLGAAVGGLLVGDRWQRVIPGPARLSVAPAARGGLRIALRLPAP